MKQVASLSLWVMASPRSLDFVILNWRAVYLPQLPGKPQICFSTNAGRRRSRTAPNSPALGIGAFAEKTRRCGAMHQGRPGAVRPQPGCSAAA